jgi:hypothetical protein
LSSSRRRPLTARSPWLQIFACTNLAHPGLSGHAILWPTRQPRDLAARARQRRRRCRRADARPPAPPLYRLERLSGRYGDPKQELEARRSVHPLAQEAFPDLWSLRRQFPQWLRFVDADFGSAAYLPLLDGARYRVSLSPRGGLVAQPADAATQRLLDQAGW